MNDVDGNDDIGLRLQRQIIQHDGFGRAPQNGRCRRIKPQRLLDHTLGYNKLLQVVPFDRFITDDFRHLVTHTLLPLRRTRQQIEPPSERLSRGLMPGAK